MRHFKKIALGIVLCVALAGCQSAKKREADAAERAQRVPLIAADADLSPDVAYATMSVYLPAAAQGLPWTQSGGNAQKNPGNRVGGDEFKIAWKKKVGSGSSRTRRLIAPPVANQDGLFIIDSEQTVRAVSKSGSAVWSVKLEPPRKRDKLAVGGGLAVAGDRIIVTSGYGYVVALDINSGAELWKRETQAPITGSPTIEGDYAYITSSNNEIYVLSLSDGSIEWSDQAIAESARVLSSPSPAISGDLLAAPFSSGEVIAYVPSNGRRLWSDSLTRGGRFTPISAINDIAGNPVIDSGAVFAASQSGVLVSIDAVSGTRLWEKPFGSIHSPALSGQFVFAISVDGQLACFDKNTGGVVWVKQLQQFKKEKKRKNRIVWAGPVIASDRIIVASSQGKVLAIDPQTGEVVNELKVGDAVYIEPIVAHEHVYLLSDKGDLIAIR
ncbi:outer membrane protein assembly factor BamB family protein [Hirschia baltica]|uniref:Pyrrolo-quinoline quinone n=1 Tax=Hirschia baltica (strain ATCC 49814 / DSM 5838 / IFAM 1418) TaxID=582402 RepID=C6XKS1_HIRBI|nr:PQQ-like beta-propeller repeat protein [Hirschia baltica]ACT59638.1 Pyrrolo-quinoline quinone [Hirschia baltica ATCC 49814]